MRLASGSGLVKVFDKHHFVLSLVVDQLIGDGADQHEPEPSRAQALLVPNIVVSDDTGCAVNG